MYIIKDNKDIDVFNSKTNEISLYITRSFGSYLIVNEYEFPYLSQLDTYDVTYYGNYYLAEKLLSVLISGLIC
jgi:hypothetical protein